MRHLVLAAAVLLAHVLTYHVSLQAQQCLYQYIEEPPRELNCDPYRSNQLRLQCRLLVSTIQSRVLTVRWFFIAASTDRALQVTRGNLNTSCSRRNSVTRCTAQISTTNPMEGGYFCQPFLPDGTPLLPSMQTTVFAPDLYIILSLPPCGAEFLSVPVARCAQQEGPNITTNATGEVFPNETVVTTVDMTIPAPTNTLHRATVTATPTSEVEGTGTVDASDTSSDTLPFPVWVFAIVGVVAVVFLSLVVACGIVLWRKSRKSRRRSEKPNFSSTRMGSCRPHTAVSTTRSTTCLITTAFEAPPPIFAAPPPAYTPPAWPSTGRQDGRESERQDPEDRHISTPSYCNATGDYFLVGRDNTGLESSVFTANSYEQPIQNSNAHPGHITHLPPTDNLQRHTQADSHHTRGPPTVVKNGNEYHTVDPSRMEKNRNHYTAPSHSRFRVGGTGHIATGDGMAVRQYQGLRIETMDYTSLYMSGTPSQLPPKTKHTITAGRKHHKNTLMI